MLIGIRCAHVTFVVAEGGGNGAVNANRQEKKSWETFRLCDVTGKPFADNATVASNTIVTLKTSGGQFLIPSWGGNVMANAWNPVGAGFYMSVLSGTVRAGTGAPVVTFRSPGKFPRLGILDGEYYWVTAELNDPRPVVANRQMPAPAPWEVFTLSMSLGTVFV